MTEDISAIHARVFEVEMTRVLIWIYFHSPIAYTPFFFCFENTYHIMFTFFSYILVNLCDSFLFRRQIIFCIFQSKLFFSCKSYISIKFIIIFFLISLKMLNPILHIDFFNYTSQDSDKTCLLSFGNILLFMPYTTPCIGTTISRQLISVLPF